MTLGRYAIVGMTLVIIAGYGRDALIAFAGVSTEANFAVHLVTKLEADRWFAYVVGALGLGYGWNQRRLRRRNIRRLTHHSAALERRLDPDRTSSDLTPEGKTRSEDRI